MLELKIILYFANLKPVKHIFSSLGLLILITTIVSCSKFETKKHYTIDDDFKTYFRFKPESRWYYALAGDTQVKETLVLRNYEEGKIVTDAYEAEHFTFEMNSNREATFIARNIAYSPKTSIMAILCKDTFYQSSDSAFKFAADLRKTEAGYGISSPDDTLNFYPNFYVGDIQYFNVLELKIKNSPFFKRLYFAKDVGIIRRDYRNGHIWLLRNYSVSR